MKTNFLINIFLASLIGFLFGFNVNASPTLELSPSSNSNALQPLWTFTPLTATTISVAANATAIIQYRVTNQSHRSHTLMMSPIQGITQITSGVGICGEAFTLAEKGSSCILSLQVNGAQLKNNITSGPLICQRNSNGQCCIPCPSDMLNITLIDPQYTIGGGISGLNANGLVLQNNGGDNLSVNSGDTSFTFATPITEGSSYNVTVLTQPSGLTCTVSNGSGINVSTNITTVNITCNSNTFSIGGSISGLNASGLVLQNNGGDNLSVSSGDTSFTFATEIAYGGGYNVTVLTQPTGLVCTVSNGSGVNVTADITNVNITCAAATFTIGGSIANLSANGLVLQNNGGDNLSISSGNTSFVFATEVAYNGSYNVTVQTQPTGLNCIVSNGSGSNVTANINNVSITCYQNFFYVGNVTNFTVTLCNFLSNSALSCSGPTGNVVFTQPTRGVTATSAASTTGAHVYITYYNGVNYSIYVCTIQSTGQLDGCVEQVLAGFNNPFKVALNSTATKAYIVNATGNDVLLCDVTAVTGLLTACVSTASGFNRPESITINPSNTFAYITNFNGNNVYRCAINGTTGALSACAVVAAGITGPEGIAIDPSGTHAYIASYNTGSVFCFNITAGTGALTACTPASTAGFNFPTAVVINPQGTYAYIGNYTLNTFSYCSINPSNGNLNSCIRPTGSFFNGPTSATISGY
ncbi:beta-propeller fold lactonase family protein [Legionella dresdenensis]|uniref:Beta-propeller fold lactonase family protein n=1 Tax=Legionella dresdenensis TaxID=450200 RepID=A0ABV8CDG0_9GAMM